LVQVPLAGRMEAGFPMSRRHLIGLVAVVAALLIVGIDVLAVHHFGKDAATKTYPDNYLNAVACPSAAQCWAVGQTGSAPGGNTLYEPRHPLLKHETAGHWSTAVLKAPGPRAALEAIACPGASDCWAVGGSASSGPAFIEHWTGGAWQLAPSPVVRDGQLDAVACASPSACWAAGGTQTHSGVTGGLLEHWNGSVWTMVTSVAGGLRPQQISCPVRGYCLALGLRGGAAAAAAYTAGQWTAVTPPEPPAGGAGRAGSTVPSLFGCAGPAMCLAAYDGTTLVTDVWNGSTWTPVSSATLSYPVGLTCSGSKGCWLLGMTGKSHPLALRWQGSGWAPVSVPAVRHSGYLSGLACGSGCWAVGGEGGSRRNGDPYTRPLIAPLA
jgi:hypothetical protein